MDVAMVLAVKCEIKVKMKRASWSTINFNKIGES